MDGGLGTAPMKTIRKRVCRLEETLGPGPETEHEKRLRERLVVARKRLESYGYEFSPTPPEELAGPTTIEILNRGREALAAVEGTE